MDKGHIGVQALRWFWCFVTLEIGVLRLFFFLLGEDKIGEAACLSDNGLNILAFVACLGFVLRLLHCILRKV
jgi:hypothetical protein